MLQLSCDRRCGCGKYTFSFCANGDIYPCDAFVGYPQFRIGNIYSTLDSEMHTLFNNLSVYENDSCSKCWCRFICGGDCYHNSYIHTHDLHAPYTNYCIVTKLIVEIVISKLAKWQGLRKNEYDDFKRILDIRQRISL